MRLKGYRQMAEILPLGLMVVDEAGLVLALNTVLANQLQCDEQQLLNLPLAELIGEGTPELDAYLNRCRQSTSPLPGRLRICIACQAPRDYLVQGCLFQPRSEDGDALVLLRFESKEQGLGRFLLLNNKLQELTEEVHRRRRAEDELRLMSEELQMHTRRLVEAKEKKDEFLATLAHELRNPLSVVSNNLYLLENLGRDDDGIVRAVNSSRGQIEHLTKLIDDLLDVTRLTTGKISIQQAPVRLATVIERAIDAAQARAMEKDINLSASGDDRAWVTGDAVRLDQVFSNLLDNALKFTPHGGRVSVDWALDALGLGVVVRVRDSGVGIREHVLSQIFDVFYQAEVDNARSAGGLGLGLALVRRLVNLHGGTIQAISEGTGKGAEFQLRFPAHLGDGKKPPPAPARASGSANYRSVLVVDDNVDAAESSALLLRLWGCEVFVAGSGEEALTLCTTAMDAAILDIGLPGMDGYKLATELRKRYGSPFMLIALSGYGTAADKRRATDAGFDHHLTKPLDLETLKRILCGSVVSG